jgi:hypothetical protein
MHKITDISLQPKNIIHVFKQHAVEELYTMCQRVSATVTLFGVLHHPLHVTSR